MNRQEVEDLSRKLTADYGVMIREMLRDQVEDTVISEPVLNELYFFRVNGISKNWDETTEPVWKKASELFTGLHSLSRPIVIVFKEENGQFYCYIGTTPDVLELLPGVFRGVFRKMDIYGETEGGGISLFSAPDVITPGHFSFGGYIKGDPTSNMTNTSSYPMDEIIRGMSGKDWCITIAAYPELGCTGQTMPVATDFGVFPNLICAGREECFQFLTDVLDELCELFPSKTIHIGGDEAAKEHWKSCPYCQAKMRELGFGDEDTLQRWYSDRIIQYLNAKGREARLWSDAFTGNDFQAEQYSIQYWMGNPGNVKYQAALGHKIICSDTAAYYMDYPYAADDRAGSRVSVEDRAGREKISPEEDLRNREEAAEKLAQYTHPINLDTILEHDPWPDWLAGGRTPALRSALLGIEAPLWTEYVPDLSTAVQRLFPRLPAVAEVAWTPELSRDNASFDERYESTAAQFAQRRLKGAAGKRLWHG